MPQTQKHADDLALALADGGYEQDARATVATVPEPTTTILLLLGITCLLHRRRLAHLGASCVKAPSRLADTLV